MQFTRGDHWPSWDIECAAQTIVRRLWAKKPTHQAISLMASGLLSITAESFGPD